MGVLGGSDSVFSAMSVTPYVTGALAPPCTAEWILLRNQKLPKKPHELSFIDAQHLSVAISYAFRDSVMSEPS